MAAKSSPGGFVVATVTNPGSFMVTITHPTGNGYCRDRIWVLLGTARMPHRYSLALNEYHYKCMNIFNSIPNSCCNKNGACSSRLRRSDHR